MRGSYLRLLWLWTRVEAAKAKKLGQNYWDISIRLAQTFLAVELLGLMLPIFFFPWQWIAKVALTINIVLGIFVVYRAAAGIGTVDILQELLPEKKKEEIPTWYHTGQVATAVGLFLSLLAIAAFVDFTNTQAYYGTLTAVVLGLFLTGLGAPATKKK